MANCDPSREVRIRRVGGCLNTDIGNISDHIGITNNQLIKPLLKEIASSFPDYMKVKREACQPCDEMRVRGISAEMKQMFENIASYIGVDVGDLIKIKLAEKSGNYPAHMKTEMEK